MAASRPSVIAAVIRKDFLSLWPLILASLLLPIFVAAEPLVSSSREARTIIPIVGIIATLALVLIVIHQDSTTSVRHDWRTRPIGLLNLVAAKVAFLLLTVAAPLFIAAVVNDVAGGHGWSEALLVALSVLTTGLWVIVPLMALGFVTGSLMQAGVVGLGLVILQVALLSVFQRVGSDPGTRWIVDFMAIGAVQVFSLVALVLLFRHQRTTAALGFWITGAAAAMTALAAIPPSFTVAAQQRLAPGGDAARQVATMVTEPCLVEEPRSLSKVKGQLAVSNLPKDWVISARGSVKYLSADGRVLPDAVPGPGGGLHSIRYDDSMSLEYGDADDIRLSAALPRPTAQATGLRWKYDISFLAPVVSHDLPADGRRRYLAGMGFCEANTGDQHISIRCFKPFAQPAAFGARLKGAPAIGCTGCRGVDFSPAILNGLGDGDGTWVMHKAGDPRTVTLTAYEARGHVARQSTTGLPNLCPKPTTPA